MMIRGHYEKEENVELIKKTHLGIELMLLVGLNTRDITLRFYDLGLKPDELGIAMAIALHNTPDKALSKLDQKVKKMTLATAKDMIDDWEKLEA